MQDIQPPIKINKNNQISLLNIENNAALSVTENFTSESMEVKLSKGDRLFLYTDGITEIFNKDENMLGENGLTSLLLNNNNNNLDEDMKMIIDGLYDFRMDTKFDDDILLIGFEIQ